MDTEAKESLRQHQAILEHMLVNTKKAVQRTTGV